MSIISRSDIRKLNMENDILTMIRKAGKLSKFDLSKLCGYSISTTISIIDKLMAEGKLVNLGSENLTVGRPAVYYAINRESGYFFGVEIYHNDLVCTAMDYLCAAVKTIRMKIIPEEINRENTVPIIIKAVNRMLDELSIGLSRLFGVGISLPVTINPDTGVIIRSKQFPAIKGYNISEALEAELKIPVFADDVVKSMCLACKWIHFENICDNISLLYIRRGIQISSIYNNILMRGEDNQAGEVGHMQTFLGNHPCYCGKKGCFVAEASEQAIVSKLRYGIQFNNYAGLRQLIGDRDEKITIDTFIELVHKRDEEILKLFYEVCGFYSIIIDQITRYYNPKRIYIYGKICEIGEPLLQKLNKALSGGEQNPVTAPEIVLLSGTIDGGHAAACMAMENLCSVKNFIV